MMKQHLNGILIMAMVLTTMGLWAQTGAISGKIVQKEGKQAISGVSIYLGRTHTGTITNGKGQFTLTEVPAGEQTISVSYLGYKTVEQSVVVKSGEEATVNIEMTEAVLDLPDVVIQAVSMTGGKTGIKEIPGSAYYLSPKEIEKFNYTDPSRALATIPGVNIQEEDGFGLRPNIGLRGTGVERSQKITLMEDGILMAPAPYVAPEAYYFPTIGRMQAAEVVKGSSQIKYGPNTTGGALNLISTQIPDKLSGRVYVMAGSYGRVNTHANVGNSHKNFGYMVETFQQRSDGFKELDNGGDTGFDKQDYLAKFRLNTNPDAKVYQSLTFKVGYTGETSNETYLGLTQADFDATPYRRYAASQKDQMNTEHWQLSARHVAKFSEKTNLTTTVYRNEFKRNWYKLDGVEADTANGKQSIGKILDDPDTYHNEYHLLTGEDEGTANTLYVKANNRSYYGQGVQSVFNTALSSGAFKHNIEIGARLHQDQIDRFQWQDTYAMSDGNMFQTSAGKPGTESNLIGQADAFAAYGQYKMNWKKLTVTPGLRYETVTLTEDNYGKNDPARDGVAANNSNSINVILPGIGVDYQWNEYMTTFAGAHKGFSPPGTTAGTEAEESINYELGTRYHRNAFNTQIVLYYTDYMNLLGSDNLSGGGAGTGTSFNAGEAAAYGVELQAGYDLLSHSKTSKFNLPVTLTYTYTDARFSEDFNSSFGPWGNVVAGDQLPYIAPHQLGLQLGIEHRRFAINLSGRYVSEMRTEAGQGAIPAGQSTDALMVLDASASYGLTRNISLFASGTNLTDQVAVVAQRPAGLRPNMPRAALFGVKANF